MAERDLAAEIACHVSPCHHSQSTLKDDGGGKQLSWLVVKIGNEGSEI